MGWVGVTTSETSRTAAVTAARVDLMAEALTDLKKQVYNSSTDRYTRQDAQRDYTQNQRRFKAINKRLTKLEDRQ